MNHNLEDPFLNILHRLRLAAFYIGEQRAVEDLIKAGEPVELVFFARCARRVIDGEENGR